MKCPIPKVFPYFNTPLKVKGGNSSPFVCGDFDKYAKYLELITPSYSQANGFVENFNRIISKNLRAINIEHKNWKQELYRFFRNYRVIPHTTAEKFSAEIMFSNRTFKTRIPVFMDNKYKVKD